MKIETSFPRYLAAKKSIDDRSLNQGVVQALQSQSAVLGARRILELGAGIGTMFERLLGWGVAGPQARYLGLDAESENVAAGRRRLPAWCREQGYTVQAEPPGFVIHLPERGLLIQAALETGDALEFCRRPSEQGAWDLLVAHAFLDLFDLPQALPIFLQSLRPGGLAYLTINFDGETALEPQLDPALDRLILQLYHRSMDERQVDGHFSGDSHAGRHLFGLLQRAGVELLAAGASDWLVYPRRGIYPADEAYFLHHILSFFEQSLSGHPELEPQRFAGWLAARHAQVERGELVYLAHQLDFLGQAPADKVK